MARDFKGTSSPNEGGSDWYGRLYDDALRGEDGDDLSYSHKSPKCALNGVEIGPSETRPPLQVGWWEELMNDPESNARSVRIKALFDEMAAGWEAERKAGKP